MAVITWLRLIVATLICVLVSSVGLAQSTATSNEHETVLSSGTVLVLAPFVEALEQDNAKAKAEWQARLKQAQARRSRGLRNIFVGLGTSAAGSVLIMTGGATISVDRFGRITDSGGALRSVGVLTSLGGAGVFWYGVYNWLKGGDEIDNLDREGRTSGYLALVPVPGGVYASAKISF